MKLKYKLAVKYFTETKNQEQLNLAYKEIESFIENYRNFKWYYSFEYTKQTKLYSLDELDLDSEIEMSLLKYNSEFITFLGRFKFKQADNAFQKGNYNVDLIKWAIEKVTKKENQGRKEDLDISKLLDETKNCEKNYLIEENSSITLLLWVALVILSIALIFTHCYMYIKNPLKFFKGING